MNSLRITMEVKKMRLNKISVFLTIIALIIIVVIPTIIKINNNHTEKLYYSVSLKFTESASKCVLDEKCNINKKILISELYELKYLDKQVNPVTKEYFNEKSYIIYKNNKYRFINLSN